MADRVVLTGYCQRPAGRQHVMFRVFAAREGLIIDAPRYCVGREAETWSHLALPLDLTSGRVLRYGCACRRTALVGDREMWDRIQRGDRKWTIAATNISHR